jgi:transcriptional regulator with XRE-family HTH domain
MMELATLDLESVLGNQKKSWHVPEHSLFAFYKREHKFTYQKIAKVLGCSHQTVFNYLTGRSPVPLKMEEALQALAQKIREHERETGKKFNTNEPVGNTSVIKRTAIRK